MQCRLNRYVTRELFEVLVSNLKNTVIYARDLNGCFFQHPNFYHPNIYYRTNFDFRKKIYSLAIKKNY